MPKRFERLVDRSDEIRLWVGSTHPERGTGRIKVNNAVVTADRQRQRGRGSAKSFVDKCTPGTSR
jgi:hypothetical protein